MNPNIPIADSSYQAHGVSQWTTRKYPVVACFIAPELRDYCIVKDFTYSPAPYAVMHMALGDVAVYHDSIEKIIEHRPAYLIKNFSYRINCSGDYAAVNPIGGRYLPEWRLREKQRLASGEYKSLPYVGFTPIEDHFVHRSAQKDEEDFIAYTPSDAYGLQDRQIRMRLGRYVKKYFPNVSDDYIRSVVDKYKAIVDHESRPYELNFATDRETINDIFETCMYVQGSSYESCLYGKFDHWTHRPYDVYANTPDVAVAYLSHSGEIVARTVVNLKDRKWIRFYTCNGYRNCIPTFRSLLQAEGYSEGSLKGCRLTVLPTGDVCLPYIDGSHNEVTREGNWWRVVLNGAYTADKTDGSATCNLPQCSACDELEEDCACYYCECCDELRPDGYCDCCDICDHCDCCISHSRCRCERCDECDERTINCECVRCEECSELVENCDCETEEETQTESEPAHA